MSGRPHVLVNMAMTADGKVDTAARGGARISSRADERRVDVLRADADAVMVGGHTLVAEDPRLTVRSPDLIAARRQRGSEPQPMRVGIVSALPDPRTGSSLPTPSRFLAGEPARVLVFTTELTGAVARRRLEAAGAEVVVLGERRVNLDAALRHLAGTGVTQLLVEGGGTLVEALLREGLVDELHLFVAPLIIGGSGAPTPVEGPGFATADAVALRLVDSTVVDDNGLVLRYQIGRGDGGMAADNTGAGVHPRSD
ncbi:MAG: dihydrofolate reductase family protein [Chloroflexi bacterium]|nr:dihydrofolate reductase family protein [Chloroflexota bacterium]